MPSQLSSLTTSPLHPGLTIAQTERLRLATIVVGGLGNIGSFLVLLLARALVGRLIIIDRDRVSWRNAANQHYSEADDGLFKAEVLAARVRREFPSVEVMAIAADLQDVPLGHFAAADIACGGLDSLHARQVLATQAAHPLGIPVVDGGVGEGLLGCVRVFVPGGACAECSWSPEYYRTMANEFPCSGGDPAGPPTPSPAFGGAAVAAMMAGQVVRLLGDEPPTDSLEIAFDLAQGRFLTSRLRRSDRCRGDHEVVAERFRLDVPFEATTIADLLTHVQQRFGGEHVQFEVRRGAFGELIQSGTSAPLFPPGRLIATGQLMPHASESLARHGLTAKDLIRVRVAGRAGSAFLFLDNQAAAAEPRP